MTRNDLLPDEETNTVYWRSEIKITDKNEKNVFLLVFGKRYKKETEPNWCEFEKIIKSLEFKE